MTDNVDFEPLINKRTLSAQVFDRLYSAILSARIEPGSKLKINQLAETLEVSVMPVREALRHLESAGLVTFTPNKKILVNEISKEDLEDVYFVLAPLEEFSLEKAFNNFNNSLYQRLRDLNEEMKNVGAMRRWVDLNWNFHSYIHEATGSKRLIKILNELRSNIKPYFYLSLFDTERNSQANLEHDMILEAYKNRDLEQAKSILRQHLNNGQRAIERLLQQQQSNK